MRITAPCKDCPNRHPHCHGECEAYKTFKNEQVKDKEAYYRDDSNMYDKYRQSKAKRRRKHG